MKTRTRWIIIGTVVLALAAFTLLRPTPGVQVGTARVTRDSLQVTVSEEGRTQLRNSFTVAAPIGGRLTRIAFKPGDAIVAGHLVAQIFPTPIAPRDRSVAQAQVAAAEAQRDEAVAQRLASESRRAQASAQLADAQARAAQSDRESERVQSLASDEVLSVQEGEQALLAARSAREQVAAAQSAVRAADAEMASLQSVIAARQAGIIGATRQLSGGGPVGVSAPVTGRVLVVHEPSERVIMQGAPLIDIGDSDQIEIVVDVLTEDAVGIQTGATVFIDSYGGDRQLRGVVRLIEPSAFTKVSALGVEEQRVHVIVDLTQPALTLGAGYRVEAHITTWVGADVLIVPTSALFQAEGSWSVFVAEGGKAVLKNVRIGHRTATFAEVLEGLDEGAEVILFPSDELSDGVAIETGS